MPCTLHPNQCYREQEQIFYSGLIMQLRDQRNDALFLPEWYTSMFLIDKTIFVESMYQLKKQMKK